MTASELRIGNFVYEPLNKTNFQIRQHNLCDFANGYIFVDPILLTDEWLLKFKFRWNEELSVYEFPEYLGNQVWVIHKGINVGVQNWEIFNFIIKAVANKKIKYVHTLQNIVFALTGEELI